MIFDRERFFTGYRASFGRLRETQVAGLNAILDSMEADADLTDIRWAAYMLATVKHECADTYHPMTERGPRSYFQKYEPTTALGRRLGNKAIGDGYKFRGQGFVMLTGLDNYDRMNKDLGLVGTEHDLVLHPEAAKIPVIAYQIMSYGMRKGRFTGKKLADYIDGEKCSYMQSRRVINGQDRASTITGYALHFEAMLKNSLVTTQEVTE